MSIPRKTTMLGPALALATLALAQQPEAELLHEGASGAIELDGDRRLVLAGMQGTFSVREGQPGEVRYAARARDNTRAERPVAVWSEGAVLTIRPVAGDAGAETLLEAVVPPGFDVRIEADRSLANVSALSGNFALVGVSSDLAARGMEGPVDVQLRGGKVLLSGVDDATVRGSGLAVTIEYSDSHVGLELKDSSVQIQTSEAELRADLENTPLTATALGGAIELAATGGTVELEQATGGGRLELAQSALTLARTGGAFEIQTDSRIQFNQHEGALKVVGYGADVDGSTASGPIDIESDRAKVALQQIGGSCTVSGRELDVQVLNPGGELGFHTIDSKLVVRKAAAPLTFETEFGSILVEEAQEHVAVTSRETDVELRGVKATVQVQAEGGAVTVAWFAFNKPEESTIDNASGDVSLQFPAAASVQLDVQAPYGQVEGELPGIRISDDGHSATGLLGAARVAGQTERPKVKVRSGADVFLDHLD